MKFYQDIPTCAVYQLTSPNRHTLVSDFSASKFTAEYPTITKTTKPCHHNQINKQALNQAVHKDSHSWSVSFLDDIDMEVFGPLWEPSLLDSIDTDIFTVKIPRFWWMPSYSNTIYLESAEAKTVETKTVEVKSAETAISTCPTLIGSTNTASDYCDDCEVLSVECFGSETMDLDDAGTNSDVDDSESVDEASLDPASPISVLLRAPMPAPGTLGVPESVAEYEARVMQWYRGLVKSGQREETLALLAYNDAVARRLAAEQELAMFQLSVKQRKQYVADKARRKTQMEAKNAQKDSQEKHKVKGAPVAPEASPSEGSPLLAESAVTTVPALMLQLVVYTPRDWKASAKAYIASTEKISVAPAVAPVDAGATLAVLSAGPGFQWYDAKLMRHHICSPKSKSKRSKKGRRTSRRLHFARG